jgi:hypothetical protein
MYGTYWGGNVDEGVVTDTENAMVETSLRWGQDTVLDATNLRNRNLNAKISLASKYGATVEFHDFPIQLHEAVRRDSKRDRSVGERVIAGFFHRFKVGEGGQLRPPPSPLPDFERYTPNESLTPAFIVDTDGTVADSNGIRGPYDTLLYGQDRVREHVATVVRALGEYPALRVISLSGRDERYYDVTTGWWEDNGIPFDDFHMRPVGDTRMDAIVKYELFQERIAPYYNVLGAFDDRPQVIRMWERIGVPVFNVGNNEEF